MVWDTCPVCGTRYHKSDRPDVFIIKRHKGKVWYVYATIPGGNKPYHRELDNKLLLCKIQSEVNALMWDGLYKKNIRELVNLNCFGADAFELKIKTAVNQDHYYQGRRVYIIDLDKGDC